MATKSATLSAMMASQKDPCFTSMPAYATVAQAVSNMVRKRRSAIVVVTRGGQPKGIVTRTDVLKALDDASDHLPLSGIMTQTLVVAGPEQSSIKALARMARSKVEHLPVVDDQRLLTVLHQSDLLRHQIEMMDADITYLKEYIDGLHNAEQD
jgi:signal-transduction protein with cAMP-binding, CBS, and nucleotidyltransferase domain